MAGIFVNPTITDMGGGIEEIRTDYNSMNLNQLISDGFQLVICEYTSSSSYMSSMIFFLDDYIRTSYTRLRAVAASDSDSNYNIAEISNGILSRARNDVYFIAIKFKTAQQ